MGHSRHHEQPEEVLGRFKSSICPDDLVVVFGAVSRLKGLIVPSVILDDFHTLTRRDGIVRPRRIAKASDFQIGVTMSLSKSKVRKSQFGFSNTKFAKWPLERPEEFRFLTRPDQPASPPVAKPGKI